MRLRNVVALAPAGAFLGLFLACSSTDTHPAPAQLDRYGDGSAKPTYRPADSGSEAGDAAIVDSGDQDTGSDAGTDAGSDADAGDGGDGG